MDFFKFKVDKWCLSYKDVRMQWLDSHTLYNDYTAIENFYSLPTLGLIAIA